MLRPAFAIGLSRTFLRRTITISASPSQSRIPGSKLARRNRAGSMLASIWLQVGGEQRAMLRSLIGFLAAQHGTVPFEPHLTVCGAPDLDPAGWDAAGDYVRHSGLLPLTV